MKPKSGVEFEYENQLVQASQGQSVLDAILAKGLDIDHSCGGNATCGTCRVFVVKGLELLADRNEIEREFAEERGWPADERLTCQMYCEKKGLQLSRPGRSVTKKGLE